MRILFLGDVFGKAGRRAVKSLVPQIKKDRAIDLAIANVENLTGGRGVDRKRLDEMYAAGIDLGTGGNHIWHNKQVMEFIDSEERLIRPANYPEPCPGQGYTVHEMPNGNRVAVINLLGRVFMPDMDCPFQKADQILRSLDRDIKIILIDFHAEATSEKLALACYLDGKISLLAGTHTHVQTADERILSGCTAFITDLGMTGPHDSIIGMTKDRIIQKFINCRPVAFVAAKKDIWLHGIILTVDDQTGKAQAIERLRIPFEG